MDPRTAATRVPDPDAVEFIRFCYRRRRVGWPELYDEMCAVAGRGLFRGYSADDLAAFGIGFSLFDMPALAALANRIVTEELALRRPVTVTISPIVEESAAEPDITAHAVVSVANEPPPVEVLILEPVIATTLSVTVTPSVEEPAASPMPRIRFAPVPAGA
jgi:hypothetical protein